MQSIKNAVYFEDVGVIESSENSLHLTYEYLEESFEVLIEAQILDNKVYNIKINGNETCSENGNNYITKDVIIGDINNMPNIIKISNSSDKSNPSFNSLFSQDYLNSLFKQNEEFDGYIKINSTTVENLIFTRLMSGDVLKDFWMSSNQIYALIKNQDSEYFIWYDGEYLTIAGSPKFYNNEQEA